MLGKKLITVLAIWIFCLCMSQALGKGASFPAMDSGYPAGLPFGSLNLESIVLAQNDSTDDDGEKPKSESDAKDSETADKDEKKSSETAPKPLKPFVPSEKIPGDQAVDFPADI